MNHSCCILILCLLSKFSFSQKEIGFDSTILIGKEKQIYSDRSIKIDGQNNKYVVGYFKGSLTIDTFTITTISKITNSVDVNARGVFIIKYDKLNTIVWLKKFAEADTLFGANVNIDNYNNIVISYSFLSKLYLDNDSLVTQSANENVNIFKYNSNGVRFDSLLIPGLAGVSPDCITFDSYGNAYIGINFGEEANANYLYIIGNDTLYANKIDFAICKLDSNLNLVWTKKYGGHSVELVASIQYDGFSLYIIGTIYGSPSGFNLGGVAINIPPNYLSKYFVAKLDTLGNGKWAKPFGNSDISGVPTLNVTSLSVVKNILYFTGNASTNTQNTFLFEGGPTLTGNGNSVDYFIASYDTAGNFKWNTISNTFSRDYLTQLITDSNANVYGVGTIDLASRFPTDTLHSYGLEDVMVCSYDSVGNFRWAINGGGTNTDIGSGIAADSDGKLYIVGGTTSSGGCVMGNDTLYPPAGQSTIFFASIDSIAAQWATGVGNYHISENALSISPNPASETVSIKVEDNTLPSSAKITVQNTLGQVVGSYKLSGSTLTINTSMYANGLYFITYQNRKATQSKKLIIQD